MDVDRPVLHPLQRKKCHGNRRDQRFRKQCRARGMKPATIIKLLKRRNQTKTMTTNQANGNNAENATVSSASNGTHALSSIQLPTNAQKRKRDQSVHDLQTLIAMQACIVSSSPVQPTSKRMKDMSKTMSILSLNASSNGIDRSYRRPTYLQQVSSILFHAFNEMLKYRLTNDDERTFIYTRLSTLDQHYYLQTELRLWQSFFDLALQHHEWPDRLRAMVKTDDGDLCRQYVANYMEQIKHQLDQCQNELTRQHSQPCPITAVSFEQIDRCLNEIVDRERAHLSKRNTSQLLEFRNEIHAKESLRTLSASCLTYDGNSLVQKQSIHRLRTIRQQQAEIWKESFMLETRVLCKILPPHFDDLQRFIAPDLYSPTVLDRSVSYSRNQRCHVIQETKRLWLTISLNIYEVKLELCESEYQRELSQLETQLLNSATTNGPLLLSQIKDQLASEADQFKHETYKAMLAFQRKLRRRRQLSSTAAKMIGVSPEPYLDSISNPFNAREWNYLSLGPACIRSNQSAIRPRIQQDIEVNNEHKDISTKVQNHLAEHHHVPRTHSILKGYSNQLLHHLNHCYLAPLSYQDRTQALQQIRTARSIRQKIKQHNLIIRVTDKGNNFYVGGAVEYERKAQAFFAETNAFELISDNPFNDILDRTIRLLNQLASKKLIYQWHCKQMMPDRTKCELAHLYFNPKTHKDGIPVRPIENTMRAPTRNISKFLDHIIRPIFNDACTTTIIVDGTSLIQQLHSYTRKGLLKQSTLFCTFDIRNLYTMLPQDEALDILLEFLQAHGYQKVKGIGLETIRELASVVLKDNVFVYDKKLYKQIIGGAMGSSFTLTLANIFMWKWQKELVRRQDMVGEFYGRYIDDIFMTWNRSEKELVHLLQEANTWHPNIKLDYKIGQRLPFLDVLLVNDNGTLTTSVYHKPAAEPSVVPFTSDHPPHVFGNVIQTALSRTIRYSSTFELYRQEQRHIRLTLLYNGYPSTFIEKEFHKFYREHSCMSAFISFIANEKEFNDIREKFLPGLTARQSQVATDAFAAQTTNSETIATTTTTTRSNAIDRDRKLIIHYNHEKRFRSFKRDMHQLYDSTFRNTPVSDVTMIVGNRNRQDFKKELIRKRPKRSLLKNISRKREPRHPRYRRKKFNTMRNGTQRETQRTEEIIRSDY